MTTVLTQLDQPNSAVADDQTPDASDTSQLDLFPISKLHVVTRTQTNRRPIKLPRSILTIAPTEQLSHYLSRVANAAMRAATTSYGSAQKAAVRLGTTDEDQEGPAKRPLLSLARPSADLKT